MFIPQGLLSCCKRSSSCDCVGRCFVAARKGLRRSILLCRLAFCVELESTWLFATGSELQFKHSDQFSFACHSGGST